MKKIAKLLKADLNGSSDLAAIAAMLSSKGRGNDTLLAHITPREAQILKAAGGSGTTNPETGLLEFYDGEVYDYGPAPTSGEMAAQQFPDYGAPTPDATASLPFSTGQEPISEAPTVPSSAAYAAPPASQYGITYGFQPTGGVGTQAQMPADFGPPTPPSLGLGYGVRDTVTPSAALETPSRPPEKSLFDKLSTPDMVRLGLAGAGALVGAGTARKAAEAGRAGKAELQTLATPYQQTGAQVQAQAQRGELTPVGQQSLQAMQARLAQGVEARGGVGAQQAAAQLEAMRQSLLQQQMDYGLKISGIGDNIAMGAIRTGLQADQAVNQLTNSMYSNMFYLASGMYPGAGRTTERA